MNSRGLKWFTWGTLEDTKYDSGIISWKLITCILDVMSELSQANTVDNI